MFAGTVFIEVTICNNWGNCGKDYGELTMLQGVSLSADIMGANVVTINRNEVLLLQADVQPMMASSNTTAIAGMPAEMSYTYEVRDITSSVPLTFSNIAVNSEYDLKLAAYSLESERVYVVKLSVTSHIWERMSYDYHYVHVIKLSTVAKISGGTVMTVSASDSIKIDASDSVDLDEALGSESGVRSGSHLGYVWVCAEDAYATFSSTTTSSLAMCPFESDVIRERDC